MHRYSIYHFKTFKSKIILLYSTLIVVALATLGYFFYHIYFDKIKQEAKQNIQLVTRLNAESIDVYFNEVINSISSIALDKSLIALLKDNDESVYYDNLKLLNSKLSNIAVANADIKDIIFMSNNYNTNLHTNSEEIINYNSYTIEQIQKSALASKYVNVKFITVNKKDYMYTKNNGYDLLVYFPVKDVYDDLKTHGTIIIKYNIERLIDICSRSKISYDNQVYLLNEEQLPILQVNNLSEKKPITYNEAKKAEDILLIDAPIDAVSWQLVFAVDMESIRQETSVIRVLAIFIIICSIIISIIISVYIGWSLTRNIEHIMQHMKRFGQGELDIRIKEKCDTEEIQTLANGFNDMADRIGTLIDDVYTSEMKQKDACIESLQSKINPHFLYNSLQLISSLAILERTEDIHYTVGAMANLYEYILYEKEQKVNVEKELSHIDDYLRLQNLRFSHKLRIIYHIDSNIMNHKIMKLSIQPIVENCINHGFKDIVKSNKYLVIKGYQENNILYFEIIDNGIGISEERIRELRDRMLNHQYKESSIGLLNVHQRIQLTYGIEYGIKVESKQGCFTKIILCCPYE